MASYLTDVAALGFSYSAEIKGPKMNGGGDNFNLGVIRSSGSERSKLLDDCVCKLHDLIILAEFSEIKGPVSLLTIPSNPTNDLGVEVDDFILKIMAVDYQATASCTFKYSNDTQVLQTDVVDGIHAYVHYFNLNDILARGFVRPLCLAYISKNRAKLEANVDVLQEYFLKVSNAMKCDNRNLFLEEVSLGLQYLKELHFYHLQWRERQEEEEDSHPSESEFMSSINVDQMIEQQNEYNKILLLSRNVNCSGVYDDLSKWRSGFSLSEEPEIIRYMGFVKIMVGASEPLIPSKKINDSYVHQNVLRPIAAISPFGVAIGIWILCATHVQFHTCSFELRGGSFWSPNNGAGDAPHEIQRSLMSSISDISQAISSSTYLKLLMQLMPPNTLSGEKFSKSCAVERGIMETNTVTSGNEASSSYYSAMDSTNESGYTGEPVRNPVRFFKHGSLVQRLDTHLSSGSSDSASELALRQSRAESLPLSGDDSSSDSADYPDDISEIYDFPSEDLWCKCIWNGNHESPQCYPGPKILHFFQTFSRVAQHILYSVLTGRTVVIAGSNNIRHKVLKIISAVIYFVPSQRGSKYLRWHRGILVSAHIEKYKVIGLCVPERLTVHDMISPRDKNCVTILDVNSKRIFGRAYSGSLLSKLEENFYNNFVSDESLVLFLQSVFIGIHQKVFLFSCLNADYSSLSGKTRGKTANDILLAMGLKGCDADIIKYLNKFVDVDSIREI